MLTKIKMIKLRHSSQGHLGELPAKHYGDSPYLPDSWVTWVIWEQVSIQTNMNSGVLPRPYQSMYVCNAGIVYF